MEWATELKLSCCLSLAKHMEDQTQAVSDDDGKFEEETDINPVGYLRVLGQKDMERTDHPIHEGVTELL